MTTIVETLRRRAETTPDRLACAFLENGELERSLSYAALDERARAIAAALQRSSAAGGRVLVACPEGLEFVAAFLGCLYAGASAVPVPAPQPAFLKRALPRLRLIIKDVEPCAILTTAALRDALAPEVPASRPCLAVDEIPSSQSSLWMAPPSGRGTPALIQYTSGSTSSPRGVVVGHDSLAHNCQALASAYPETAVGVNWLPLFHDMGLVGTLLFPLYAGFPAVLMPPLAFLQRPARWLRAISRYSGRHGQATGVAPTFAYRLCADKIKAEELEGLDLSLWTVALNGADFVRFDVLEAFAKRFAPAGFQARAFCPCYGLAEATLIVSGAVKGRGPSTVRVDRESLDRGLVAAAGAGAAWTLVGSGAVLGGQQAAVVDPETRERLPPDRVGEVWVKGPSVARGYWGRVEETARVFDGRLAGAVEGPFLRTGDLGFLRDGELFITGRLKDIIVIHGVNRFPTDIERTAELSHPLLRPGGCAAFGVELDGEERLVIVSEVDRRAPRAVPQDRGERARQIRAALVQAVNEEHQLSVHDVVFVRSGALPRTSSGKLQRRACRSAYLAGELEHWAAA